MRVGIKARRRKARRAGEREIVDLCTIALSDPDVIAETATHCGMMMAAGDEDTFWDRLIAWIMSPEFIEFIKMIIGLFSDQEIRSEAMRVAT
jgi:hypothetical protein